MKAEARIAAKEREKKRETFLKINQTANKKRNTVRKGN
jgi:hypothetical protein